MKYIFIFILNLSGWILLASPALVNASDKIPAHEDTMLMFVGESLEVLSIASRREESAWQAPAVAQVITRKSLQKKGTDTISKALETIPGFYMRQREWGTGPYLRGIPDSMLLLYDTVPVTSDISKTFHPFDRELSLASVKRIEVIKGPGSVLWGPDAFAGIVNIVPMTGKDLNGAETGVLYGVPNNHAGAYANLGYNTGTWDGFLSISGYTKQTDDTKYNVVKFWGNEKQPVEIENRYGNGKPDNSQYIEASGRFSYADWLTISGIIADNKTSYAMTSEENISWGETLDNPLGLIKIEAKKAVDHFSVLRITSSFFQMKTDHQIIDRTLSQKETTCYGEIIYDRSFWSGTGLFTGGVSFREKHIKNAPVWDGYFPDYLSSDNLFVLPIITKIDYNTRLWSIFGQYSHRVGDAEIWLGLRNDNHDSYQDRTSLSTGLSWSPSSKWILKVLYGTAYRTPFAKQLREDEKPDLENIKSFNIQAVWEPSWQWKFGICGFWNKIDNHVMEDPYAGLSMLNHQEFTGMELQAGYSPISSLNFDINFTLVDNKGPEEEYFILLDTIIDSDGNEIRTYEKQNYPYDMGPGTLFNFMINWNPAKWFSTHLRLGYTGSFQTIHPRGKTFLSGPGLWLMDAASIINDVIFPDTSLELSIKNITDRRYKTPGIYNNIEGQGIQAQIIFRKVW